MVVVPKKDGKSRICLDPQDLNEAIRREHYPLPTIEYIATRLHGAKVFTVLDVHKGFCHVELAEDSSFLTTLDTPFGRYRWKRMPFGICSAPEVFQWRIHEFVKGPVVVIPAALRLEMMARCHATHIGIKRCLRRARELIKTLQPRKPLCNTRS